MGRHITSFDTGKHHIHIEFLIMTPHGITHSVAGILDTGAPVTEFSDHFLTHTGFLEATRENVIIPPGLQTHKYGKLTLPSVEICGHEITCFEVVVSYFEASWGIDALVGLDFFRRFLITIDYAKGILITQPFEDA